ncbi:MAG: hypothetical protein J6127_03695 [Clostridiales bacterium]|nr:hypothetical protein [Clostridiales bacterium]
MASDVKFAVKDGMGKQLFAPVTVSEELQERYLKRSKSTAIGLIPISIVACALVIGFSALIIYFFHRFLISVLILGILAYPAFAVYNLISTFKAIKNRDYEFFSGQIIGKNDKGYVVKGLEDQNIVVMLGKDDYNPGEFATIARLGSSLDLISEDA